MITTVEGHITRVYESPRLTRKYIASFVVVTEWAWRYPELAEHFSRQPDAVVGKVFDVYEGWGCRVLEGYPGMQRIHVGRKLEDACL